MGKNVANPEPPDLGLGAISTSTISEVAAEVAADKVREAEDARKAKKVEKELYEMFTAHAEMEGYEILRRSMQSYKIEPLLVEAVKEDRSSIIVKLESVDRDTGFYLLREKRLGWGISCLQRHHGQTEPLLIAF